MSFRCSRKLKVFLGLQEQPRTNAIEESDFLLGCLRMRGGASGVDMVRIQMEQECRGQRFPVSPTDFTH